MNQPTQPASKNLLKLLLVVGLGSSWTIANAEGVFDLMTRNPESGALSNSLYNSQYPAITPDGRYVVYETTQSVLLTQANNGKSKIFLFDRINNRLELISADNNGVQGNDSSYRPAISADGCKIVFYSYASNLVANDTNNVTDVFLRNRCKQPAETTVLSVSSAGALGNAASDYPDISADGNWVAFSSYATNFVTDNLRGASQIYLADLRNATTTRISAPFSGVGDGGGGRHPAISADGSRVAFWSFSSSLVSNDTNGVWDIFLYDRNTSPTISIASVDIDGNQRAQGNESSSRIVEPAISSDGRYISFASTANNLVANDTNNAQDVFVKDTYPSAGHVSGAIIRASVTSSGIEGNGDSPAGQGERAALSGNGMWVVFSTHNAKNLTADGKGYRTIAHNNQTGETIELSTYSGSTGSRPAISGTNPSTASDNQGRFVAFFDAGHLDTRFSSAGVFLNDRTPDTACVFNWIEANYGAYAAPSGGQSQYAAPYIFRYYKDTKSYLGISTDNYHTYYLGADGNLFDIGVLTTWLDTTSCKL